jgi:predicted ATP-dependent endonuclease of OLD family
MGMSDYDYAQESVIEEMLYEAVMKKAAKEQCIYLFVEGESEEKAFPILIENTGINLEELGITIANYNGSGNLIHSLRLLNKTLSHNRPIIITIDNDKDGGKIIKKISKDDYKNDLLNIFPIPAMETVIYPSGHKGGSFEEIFTAEHFLNCCFSKHIMDSNLVNKKNDFERYFDVSKPWYDQVKKYCANNGFTKFSSLKVDLAEYMAEECDNTPDTITQLSILIKGVREKHPVKNPNDVELPKIKGLTC